MDKESILDVIKNNIASFLAGWLIGANLLPAMLESLQV